MKRTVTLVMIVMIVICTFGFSVVNAASCNFEFDSNSLDYNNDGIVNAMDLSRAKYEFISGNTNVNQNDIAELKDFLFGKGSPKLIEPPLLTEAISYSSSCYNLTKYETAEEATKVVMKFTDAIKTEEYDISVEEITEDTVTIKAKNELDCKYLIVKRVLDPTAESNLVYYYNNDFVLLYSIEYGAVALLK